MTPTIAHFTQGTSSPLLAIAPGPTRILVSSASMQWKGVLIEKHLTLPGERVSASIDRHVITMVAASCARLEYRTAVGRLVPCIQRTGELTLTPVGPAPDMRLLNSCELIQCALEQGVVRSIVDEMDCVADFRPAFRAGVQDKSIERLLGLLVEELETDIPSGRLYIESLTHALATRYLLLNRLPSTTSHSRISGLPARILNRVREKIEANLDADLSLDNLAEETGYSRAHFLRMFRVATGLTPHQYVLDLRLRRAQDCLRQKNSSMIDIALSCGFSSQSHMTSVFRQRLEMTPGEFRRDVKSNSSRLCHA